MNEEIEYAEMLEIPVSTVNVMKKQSKKRKAAQKEKRPAARAKADAQNPLKDSLIQQVNGKLADGSSEAAENENIGAGFAPEAPPAQAGEPPFQGLINYDEGADEREFTERIDTVRLLSSVGKKKNAAAFTPFHTWNSSTIDAESLSEGEDFLDIEYDDDDELPPPSRGANALLKIEFALACALSAGIFLTNVFMPNSAINTFFASLKPQATSADLRPYDDFTLSGVVSARSDAEITLSETGVLTVTGESMIYPAADGTVSEITKTETGAYVVKISHSDTFTGLIEGLDEVFYSVGDTVKGNVPMGYTKGETAVQVTMYSEGELLNCFEITEDDRLVWIENADAE